MESLRSKDRVYEWSGKLTEWNTNEVNESEKFMDSID